MEIVTVSLVLRLDVEAIQDRADLATWARMLGVGAGNSQVTWEEVYEELSKVLVGAEHYSKFSATALSDVEAFTRLVRTSEIKVHRGEVVPPQVAVKVDNPPLVENEPAPPIQTKTTVKKVVTPPPPPPPNGRTPTKA